MRKEDINKYTTTSMRVPSQHTEGEFTKSAGATVATMGGMVWKVFKTVFWIAAITGLLVFWSVASYILSFRNAEPPDINAGNLNYSSEIYLMDEAGNPTEYLPLYRNENRVWMPLEDIPLQMQTAQVCIEDHRFYQHHGVDWKGTAGAVLHLMTGQPGRGGSTLTQQLIKNITGENQVSIMRKVTEIFTALNMEKDKYTKAQILEAYLNIVNYGGICQGVESAAQCYFEKSITECSLAECALIAGITQNPYQYNPLIFPEESKEKAELVLDRMLELSESGEMDTEHLQPITRAEYNQAIQELAGMDFIGADIDEEEDDAELDLDKWNWYIDDCFNQVKEDLMDKYGYSEEYAETVMYNGGLSIYCAMDYKMQNDIERLFLTNLDMLPADDDIDTGFYAMDPYTGRVLVTIGSRYERTGALLYSNATQAMRPCGSSMKTVSPYPLGIENGTITYGTLLKNQPLADWNGIGGEPGPANWNGRYTDYMCVDQAIEMSMNAPAAQLCTTLTAEACYEWLTEKLHFSTLTADVDAHSRSAMALGTQYWGVTVADMTSGYQIFANGGVYHRPVTYYYVQDHSGNVILDNREGMENGERVMREESATIMNKLLEKPIYYANSTGGYLADMPMKVFGKTGTTDDDYDLYFVGGTPFCVAGVWNGYTYSRELGDGNMSMRIWKTVMNYLYENYDWGDKSWILSDNVYSTAFCRSSGKLAGPSCFNTATGWYEPGNAPGTCNGGSDHITGPSPSPSASPSAAPSVVPSVSPSASPSADPSADPSTGPADTPEPPPSFNPTPSDEPTTEPTQEPTQEPTETPTQEPTEEPTDQPPEDHTPDVPG